MMIMSITEKIEEIITPSLDAHGYAVVCIHLLGAKRQVLRIMIENKNETPIAIEDCVKASREISSIMDEVDPIQASYNLEVSSAGLDRPLVKMKDFERFVGNPVKLETHTLVEGRKRFKGMLDAIDQDLIIVTMEEQRFQIPYREIRLAKLDPDMDFAHKKGSNQKSKAKT